MREGDGERQSAMRAALVAQIVEILPPEFITTSSLSSLPDQVLQDVLEILRRREMDGAARARR